MSKFLKFSELRRDPALQSRVAMDPELIADYRDAILRGDRLPPVSVVFDRQFYFLVDGWHRCAAQEAAGKFEVEADIVDGKYRDAMLASVGANHRNGARRTNADKRRAVQRLLDDPEWAQWSNEAIAKVCVVSPHTVAEVRQSHSANAELPSERTYTTKHGTRATMKTASIGTKTGTRRTAEGKQPAAPVAPVDPAENADSPDSPDANQNAYDNNERAVAPEVHAAAGLEPEVAPPATGNDIDALLETDDRVALRAELLKRDREIAQIRAEVLTLREFRDGVLDAVTHSRLFNALHRKLLVLINRVPLGNNSASNHAKEINAVAKPQTSLHRRTRQADGAEPLSKGSA